MNLPTQAQVNAAARHAASFAAGAIMVLGLSSKISPDQVTAIINSTGTLVNDGIVVIGLVTPLVTAFMASRSASPQAQINAVAANPAVTKVVVTDAAVAAAAPSDKVDTK